MKQYSSLPISKQWIVVCSALLAALFTLASVGVAFAWVGQSAGPSRDVGKRAYPSRDAYSQWRAYSQSQSQSYVANDYAAFVASQAAGTVMFNINRYSPTSPITLTAPLTGTAIVSSSSFVPSLVIVPGIAAAIGQTVTIGVQGSPFSTCVITLTLPDGQLTKFQMVADETGYAAWKWTLQAKSDGQTGRWIASVECAGMGRISLPLTIQPKETSPDWLLWVMSWPVWAQAASAIIVILMLIEMTVVAYRALINYQVASRTRGLRALNDATIAAASKLKRDTALRAALEEIAQALGWPAGVIHLFDVDTGDLQLACSAGELILPCASLESLPKESPMREAFSSGELTLAAGPTEPAYLYALSNGQPRVCIAAIPIRSGERILGTLTLASPRYRALAEDEQALLLTLGAYLGVLVENLDAVEALRAQTARLDTALTDLRTSEAKRDALVSNIMHDLRSPLATISGYADILLGDEMLAEAVRSNLQIISNRIRQMWNLVEEILAFEQPERIRLNLLPVNLASLVNFSVIVQRPLASKHSITLKCNVPGDIPPVLADENRLPRVFDNLLSNALKFTPDGGMISVSAHYPASPRAQAEGAQPEGPDSSPSPDGNTSVPCTQMVEVRVSDTGRGISPDKLERIFSRFYQVNPNDRQSGGLGLGLDIAIDLVRQHGGQMWVESQVGQGTTFYFTLPIASIGGVTDTWEKTAKNVQ